MMNDRMREFLTTHKMPDHTEQHVQEILGAIPVITNLDDEVLPSPDTVIQVDQPEIPLPLPDDEKRLMDESVKEATMCVELPSSPKTEEIKTMDEVGFPKYQYSVFLDASRNGQLVIRANSWEEFVQLRKNADPMLSFILPVAQSAQTPTATTPAQPVQPPVQTAELKHCATCNAVMQYKEGFKNGKKWSGYFCPNADKNDKYTHKPIWE